MLKQLFFLLILIVPALNYSQTEKGVWVLNGSFNFHKLSEREVPRLYEENRNFAISSNVGLYIKDNNLLGFKCRIEKSYPFNSNLWRQGELDFQIYFKRYFGKNKIRFFGTVEGGYFKRKTFYDTVLTKDEKTFASFLGLGASYFLSPNVALEFQFLATSFEKQNSILEDFYLKTNIQLFLNSKRPYKRDLNWKLDYLEKGNIIFGLSSVFGISSNDKPNFTNFQPSFSMIFKESFRWENSFQFRKQAATENRHFKSLEYQTSLEYFDILLNDDWLVYKLGLSYQLFDSRFRPKDGGMTLLAAFGIRLAGERNLFYDINIGAELALESFNPINQHSNVFGEIGFETFFYQNLTFECNFRAHIFDINTYSDWWDSQKPGIGYGIVFGFNYYLLRNNN